MAIRNALIACLDGINRRICLALFTLSACWTSAAGPRRCCVSDGRLPTVTVHSAPRLAANVDRRCAPSDVPGLADGVRPFVPALDVADGLSRLAVRCTDGDRA